MKTNTRSVLVAALSLVIAACGGEALVTEEAGEGEARQGMTWDEFLTHIYFEPETGVYVVDGDTPIENEKKLREFYESNVKEGQLIVHRNGSVDAKWNDTQKLNLTYCVSYNFGNRYDTVVQAMAQATGAWMAAANVKFIHKADQDSNCTSSNSNVVFDVNPVNVNGEYLARAFFPDQTRSTRNVLIDSTAFTSSGNPTLAGILRHELGHSLGFRHEHTRPESGACFEDNNWRALTTYDSDSVMHYPQCNGTGDWSLSLTARDISGAASLYGNPGVSEPTDPTPTDPTDPTEPTDPTTPAGQTKTENFSGDVAKGKTVFYGPFEVEPSSLFEAVMSGSGDPDLYVRFGAKPTTSSYDCRPYKSGAAESCSVNVPTGKTTAYVMIRGYSAASYQLKVTYTGKVQSSGGGSTPMTANYGGSLARDEMRNHGPLPVVVGSTFSVVMSGSGDADLYVKFGAQATQSNFDCRPYLDGSAETCTIKVPAGASQAYIMVHGYTASTYNLDVSYVAP